MTAEERRKEREAYERELRLKEERRWAEFRKGLHSIMVMQRRTRSNSSAALPVHG